MKNLKEELRNIIAEDGNWSAHNIYLEDDVYTIDKRLLNDELKLPRVIQNISDFTKKDFKDLRVLDLACLEGMFGIEAARHGAKVTLLDARDINLKRSKFVCDALNLNNVEIVKDDVRNITPEKYGMFDVILCFGIFYHLDKNDLFNFVKSMYNMTNDIVMFDTHITYSKNITFTDGGYTFSGESYREHREDSSEKEKMSDLWKSLDNNFSFYLTLESLVRMCSAAGFTSVVESFYPPDNTKNKHRVSITAFKGESQKIYSSPFVKEPNPNDVKEKDGSKELIDDIVKFKNSVRYNLGLNSPRFVKEVYQKYIKGKDYKKVKS
ncbi:MAG: class I SAM-dependent methyltransferase [Candidatus Kapaibacterium sp.]|jgi:predicted nicotinamide N-methyase|nr:class I SAM-dependent methyltransferase [Candidatus Kapabacteria bacterium]